MGTNAREPHESPIEAEPAAAVAREFPLARWLLAVPQLREGPHVGAVAGVLEGTTAFYVYPEIAGYYLRWLAFRALRGGRTDELALRATATLRWLEHWCGLSELPTRVHLDGTRDDWRNGALFCFDLAMVLRGLGSCVAAGLVAADGPVADEVGTLLRRCIGRDGAFDATVPLHGAASLPERWSTRRGAFLAKAAAGVLRAATQLPVEPQVVAAAERTFADSIDALATSPHPEVHPLLYACEGVLELPQHPRFPGALPIVAACHARLLELATSDGYLPESMAAGAEGPERIDVIAQALRVAWLLSRHGRAPRDAAALARLRQALDRHIDGDGVPFARQSTGAQRNTWAAMFADQALTFAAAASAGDPWWHRDPLIV